jgi:hypothetical protein
VSIGDHLAEAGILVVAAPLYIAASVVGALGHVVAAAAVLADDRRQARRYRAYPAS